MCEEGCRADPAPGRGGSLPLPRAAVRVVRDIDPAPVRPEGPIRARTDRVLDLLAQLGCFAKEVVEAPHQRGYALFGRKFVGHVRPKGDAKVKP